MLKTKMGVGGEKEEERREKERRKEREKERKWKICTVQ